MDQKCDILLKSNFLASLLVYHSYTKRNVISYADQIVTTNFPIQVGKEKDISLSKPLYPAKKLTLRLITYCG